MPGSVETVNVKIRKEADGFFVATSVELPGLVLANKDIHAIMQDIPVTISALYEANFGTKVQVVEAFPASSEAITLPPTWMVMRPEDGSSHLQ